MTLRTAARLGMIGMAIPAIMIVAEIVVATIAGIPTGMVTATWDWMAIARNNAPDLILLIFLFALYRTAKGSTSPARLSDTAMAAAILLIAVLAMNLRWSMFGEPLFHRNDVWGWIHTSSLLTGRVLEPFAWLAFLVTFVRLPEPPMQTASRRVALVLAPILLIGGAAAVAPLVVQSIVSWGVVTSAAVSYGNWNHVVTILLTALRYLLLLIFAIAAWRARPKDSLISLGR